MQAGYLEAIRLVVQIRDGFKPQNFNQNSDMLRVFSLTSYRDGQYSACDSPEAYAEFGSDWVVYIQLQLQGIRCLRAEKKHLYLFLHCCVISKEKHYVSVDGSHK